MLYEKNPVPPKKSNAFKESIHKLIELCDEDKTKHYNMFKVASSLNFHKRRFYDVINVLEVLEVCIKLDTETFLWNGMANIKDTIHKIAYINRAFSKEESLARIIPSEECISIGKVTIDFLLCFISLQQQCLNIKNVSIFLSRDNCREKTTLCKLYQITHVFESIGLITKTSNTSEYRLQDEYFISPEVHEKVNESPLSINSLLNKQSTFKDSEIVKKRRQEFQKLQIGH